MSKQQTAVEWLMEQLSYDNGFGERWASKREDVDLAPYFAHALEIERQQIQRLRSERDELMKLLNQLVNPINADLYVEAFDAACHTLNRMKEAGR